MLNNREFEALDHLSMSIFEFEEEGKMGPNVGKVTIQGLIEKGYIVKGESTRHRGCTGYAMTEAGKLELNEEYNRRAPKSRGRT